MLRVQSPLSDDVERLIHDTIGCCIRVHRELGPGLFERIYTGALCIELKAAGIRSRAGEALRRELPWQSSYPNSTWTIVVGNQVVLEVKSVDDLAPIHHKQILNYMRIARLRAGLLVNFNVALLPDGLSRKIL